LTVRILFAGTAGFAHALLTEGWDLRCVALPYLDQEEPETWALLGVAGSRGLTMVPARALTARATPADQASVLAAGPYDVLLCMTFDRRISPWARGLAARGAFNVHPSLLPRHRGYNPYYWTILAGDRVAGVSVHRMTDEYDAGDVVLQRTVEVPLGCDSGRLWRLLNSVSVPAAREVLGALQSSTPLTGKPQDDSLVTQAPRPSAQDLRLEVSWPVERVVRSVRAATPEPGAHLDLDGTTWVVRGAQPGPAPPPHVGPGDVFQVHGTAFLAVGDGSVRLFALERVQDPVEGSLEEVLGLAPVEEAP
jgi:methionyl-tRNA formyltransferase